MTDCYPLLVPEQLEALFEAKKSLSGTCSIPLELVPPLNRLVVALQQNDNSIVILRHGATAFSEAAEEKLAGGVAKSAFESEEALAGAIENIPLSETGVAKTKQYAESREGALLREFAETAHRYVSPMRRTVQTQEIVFGDMEFEKRADISEQHLGDDFGMLAATGRALLNDSSYDPEGGESAVSFAARAIESFVSIVETAKKENRNVLIVTHSNLILTMFAAATAYSGGAVMRDDRWNGKVESYKALKLSRPENGIRYIRPFFLQDRPA